MREKKASRSPKRTPNKKNWCTKVELRLFTTNGKASPSSAFFAGYVADDSGAVRRREHHRRSGSVRLRNCGCNMGLQK